MVIGHADGRTFARRLERRAWLCAVFGNLLGAAIAAVNVAFWAPVFLDGQRPAGLWPLFAVAIGVMGIAIPIGRLQVRRNFAPIFDWVSSEREATEEERRALLSLPVRSVVNGLIWWTVVAVLTGLLDSATPSLLHGSLPLAKAEFGVVACAAVGSAFTYLLVERAVRPLYAALLSGDTSMRPARLGITSRLLIVWAMVSAAPLIGTATQFLGLTDKQRLLAAHVVVLSCTIAIPAGFIVMFAAARSIADPLREVRRALRRVEEGDLDIELAVDDTGEVGMVQSGFNRMVAGLRTSRRTQELFGRHVGAEVADLALRGEDELGGVRHDATVLFVDIVGSTQITHHAEPGHVVALLNDLFDAVVRVVKIEGGWVNKFTGDGALCVFGPPAGDPDHAAQALRAARGIRTQIERLQDRYDFEAAIGVSTGDVVAGNVGASNRYEYTLIGDAVNEAARLTDEAKDVAGHVLVSETAVRRAGIAEGRHWATAGAVQLRGRTSPTNIFEPQVALERAELSTAIGV